MIYRVLWRDPQTRRITGSGTVHSWDGRVVDCTPFLGWLLEKPVNRLLWWARGNLVGVRQVEIRVTVEDTGGAEHVLVNWRDRDFS